MQTKYGMAWTCVLAAASVLGAASPAIGQATPAKGAEGVVVINGQTEPSAKVEVPSVLRGQLVRVSVKEGQVIKKGDEIAQLDDEIQKQTVALAQLEADSTVEIRAAETQVDFNRNMLERIKKLAGVASPTELREKELAVKQAELALEQKKETTAKKKIDLAREQATLDRMTIRSPLDGSVLRVNKQSGELVDLDKPIAVVVQMTKLNARFYPPKQVFGHIKVGGKMSIEIRLEPAIHREATVIAVDPILDPASQLFQVKVEIDNPDQAIPAGTLATWTWDGK